jgi:hypothetical protein
MWRFWSIGSLMLLSACVEPQAPVPPAVAENPVATFSTATLWAMQETTTSAGQLRLIEAELGTRGQFVSGASYTGKRTASEVGTRRFDRRSSGSGDRDCGSFASSAAAQRFFLLNGGPSVDRHNLDGDGDGYACEWGAAVRGYAAKYRPAAITYKPARAYRSSGACHRGPRGGTYTITASGGKNYDGC